MKLTGPEFFQLKGLRVVRRGRLAISDGRYYEQGVPVLGCLVPTIAEGLLEAGLLELGDPDKSGMRPVALTDAGQARYRELSQLQRRKAPETPPPERDRTTETT